MADGLSSSVDADVVVIGAGVVGAAIAYSLSARGVSLVVAEAESEPALGASGTNSGILHTGFDSTPGELETDLILRAAKLRPPVLERLGVPVIRCGALLRPTDDEGKRTVTRIADEARVNGVEVALGDDGTLEVPGESITDPVAYTRALLGSAVAGGAELRTGTAVDALRGERDRVSIGLDDGSVLRCRVAVNCAGLRADWIARLAGDESFAIYPRKGEFFVFDPPGGEPLERILLPVPTKRTKGVLVFPTLDGKLIAGPTAVDGEDKDDWSVRSEAFGEVMPKTEAIMPALSGADPIAAYAGLRPAGRGCNYVIGASAALPRLINVAAVRSTGLTASLGIAEQVTRLVADAGVALGPTRDLPKPPAPAPDREPWWRRASRRAAISR